MIFQTYRNIVVGWVDLQARVYPCSICIGIPYLARSIPVESNDFFFFLHLPPPSPYSPIAKLPGNAFSATLVYVLYRLLWIRENEQVRFSYILYNTDIPTHKKKIYIYIITNGHRRQTTVFHSYPTSKVVCFYRFTANCYTYIQTIFMYTNLLYRWLLNVMCILWFIFHSLYHYYRWIFGEGENFVTDNSFRRGFERKKPQIFFKGLSYPLFISDRSERWFWQR